MDLINIYYRFVGGGYRVHRKLEQIAQNLCKDKDQFDGNNSGLHDIE